MERDFIDFNAVDENLTGEYVNNAGQRDGERTFAGARATNNTYLLSALNLDVQALQNDVSSRPVAHFYVFDLNRTLGWPISCLVAWLALIFVLNVKQLENFLNFGDLVALLGHAVQHPRQFMAKALNSLKKH